MLSRISVSIFVLIVAFSNAAVIREFTDNKVTYTIKHTNDGSIVSEAYLEEENDLISSATMWLDGNSTGWWRLKTWTNAAYTDYASYTVGQNEAHVSVDMIAQHWHNNFQLFCLKQEKTCKKIRAFIKQNTDWVEDQIKSKKDTDRYWYQVYLVYRQINGIQDGYDQIKGTKFPTIPKEDFLLMNLLGDLNDLVEKFEPETSLPNKFLEEGHGTSLVKLVVDNKGLVAGHATSGKYSSLLRIAKQYEHHYEILPKNGTYVNSAVMSFSSYPGIVHSGDAFYTLESGLVIQKTSIFNANKNLWNLVKPKGSVFGFVRTLVANRLAKCAHCWTKIFPQYNSGTANGQYVIVNYNKFTKGEPLKEGAIFVLEQIPGHITAEDQTEALKTNTYWASYNIPYYKDIYKLSGSDKLVKQYGAWFSYTNTPRAKIIKRDHKTIKCCCGMMALLRSNNYKHDPLSKCKCKPSGYSASNAIAPRQDLNSPHGSYPIPYLGFNAGGAIDAKLVTADLVPLQQFKAVNGPTTGTDLPIFKWSTSSFKKTVRHQGQVDEFNFKPIVLKWG